MELEHELNKRRAAPTWFWIQLILLAIATIIAFFLLNDSDRKDQINTEKRIAEIIMAERSIISKN